jgi:preprotein translocase subunit SecG
MTIGILTLLHVVVSMFLILVVLLQQGKGQDFASTFGGGGTQTAFGARSSTTVLHRLTTISAILFMVTSLSLTILISRPGADSVLDNEATGVQQPLTPEPAGVTAPDAGAGAEEEPEEE